MDDETAAIEELVAAAKKVLGRRGGLVIRHHLGFCYAGVEAESCMCGMNDLRSALSRLDAAQSDPPA